MLPITIDSDRYRRASVLTIGDVMLDTFVYGDVTRISPEAPIPVLNIRSQNSMPGGAANVAANVAALGAQSTIISVVGRDEAGDNLHKALRSLHDNYKTQFIIDSKRPTSLKIRYIAGAQQLMRADWEVVEPIRPDTAAELLASVRRCVADHDIIALSDYGKGVLTDLVISSVIEIARAAGKIVIVDPKRLNFAGYRGATYIKPNLSELARATGMRCTTDDEAEAAANVVIAETGAAVLLTRSEKGISLFRAGGPPVHVRTTAREVFDVSGAGDTALAAFAAALAAGEPEDAAIHIANAAAGVAVSKRGTALVSFDELAASLSDGLFFDAVEGVVSPERAAAIAKIWKGRGLKVGFTNGCFDIVHSGHVTMLGKAAAHCDRLVVGLNTDASVRRLKGPSRPVQVEASRVQVLANMKNVDLVTLFDDDTPLELIKAIEPDVLFKGADYSESQVVGGDFVKERGGKVVLIDLVENMSTTNAIRRAMGSQQTANTQAQ